MRYALETKADLVVEKFRSGAAVRAEDGKWSVPEISLGWFVQIGTLAICVGLDKPGIQSGDKIRIVVEKVDGKETSQVVG